VGSMIPRSQKTLVAVGLSGAPWRLLTLLLKRSERSYKPGVAGSKPARSTNKIKGFLRFDALGDLTARNHSHQLLKARLFRTKIVHPRRTASILSAASRINSGAIRQ
jgi:hypothetical protein